MVWIQRDYNLTINLPLSVFGVSSHLFLLALGVAPWPGVSRPGVAAPDDAWPGVTSHCLVLAPGVAPGVSAPFERPGVSSHRLLEGVPASTVSQLDLACLLGGASSVDGVLATSQRRRFAGCAFPPVSPLPLTTNVPSLALDFICSCKAFWK